MPRKRKSSKNNAYYINNRDFTDAIVEHIRNTKQASAEGRQAPQITNYIADCFMRIAQGLGKRWNFNGYTYRDEMEMDGVENCLRYINSFNIDRCDPSKLNAFSYFTQICYFAFIRRIKKEAKQQDIKLSLQQDFSIEDCVDRPDLLSGDMLETVEKQINQIKSNAAEAFAKEK